MLEIFFLRTVLGSQHDEAISACIYFLQKNHVLNTRHSIHCLANNLIDREQDKLGNSMCSHTIKSRAIAPTEAFWNTHPFVPELHA